ncbi:galactose oxidase [Fulvivirga maritima]|uniref:Kelch repeat-containing protein n=1 Tax=Fulvivirga maritima TaxID=2904247 RepID=UPI001F31C408|nr:kelch repeat-containing protein [Fulvivirga maritima]UII25639.1 galactose oxidase [Fulvivirga maritima]
MSRQFKFMPLLLVGVISLYLAGCTSDSDESTSEDGNWIKRSSMDGRQRSGAVSFVVGNKAYIGLGFDGDDYLRDFWSYNPDNDNWVKLDSFPGIGRSGAVAFAIGSKGYVGTGYNNDSKELKDFWEYDTENDSWTQVEDYGGSARLHAVAFAYNDRGYVGTGNDGDNYLKDFYSYDPATDSWREEVSIKGEKRDGAVAFTVDDRVFVGTGTNNGIYQTDFFEFVPESTDIWVRMTELDDDDDYAIVRRYGVAFGVEGMGFITTGSSGSNLTTTWAYDPVNDIWEERTAFEGLARQGAIGFTVNGRSFVGLGTNSSQRFDDLWEFLPLDEYDDDPYY